MGEAEVFAGEESSSDHRIHANAPCATKEIPKEGYRATGTYKYFDKRTTNWG